jgi:hypothetical protein
MLGSYTIYDRSMNGVKTLSDGISFITDGSASHNDIIYSDFLQSSDQLTILTNDTVTTVNINCDLLTADTTSIQTMNATTVDCDRLYVRDPSNNIVIDFNGGTNNLAFNGISNFNNTINVTNKNIVQTQTGEINQSGTGTNDLKDTNINGFLVVGSNITQSGGSTSLKDVTCDNLTLRSNKSITQTGTSVSNTFAGTSTIKDLIILDSVIFPSSVVIPGTTTSDDIIMEDDSVIIQDLTVEPSGKTNIFRNTKTLTLEVDGDFDMIEAGSTATLKNTIIQGTAEIQGDITQTTGATVLKTISCNNITLNVDQNITQTGTGYITQSGTGQNNMKEINLTNNSNLLFNGNGIISQPLNTSINILNNFRCAGYGIVGGRNNTTFSNTQNIQNNNGLQLQFNRDNSSQYSFLMNNRGTGGNGGFRFQRYVGGVYLDEPLTIDNNITMNKNLSIPGGSISCSSATLGNISQSELDCLDNCAVNIQTQFNTIDSQIASLQTTTGGVSAATTGITYIAGTDTTLIDNNLTISSGKNLVVGTTNVITAINNINSTLSGITYDAPQDLTTVNNNMLLPAGNNLLLGTGYNVKTNIDDCITKLSGMTYTSGTDTTNIDNNVQITNGKKLYIGTMDVEAEIIALDTSFTTGTINSTNLTTNNLNVNTDARFGQVGGTTYIKNDVRYCNVVNKSESEFTQFYHAGSTINIINHLNNGSLSYQAKNNSGVITEYLRVNPTSVNVKNTNVDIDTNLNVDGTTTLNNLTVNNDLVVSDDLNVSDNFVVNNCCETFANTIGSVDYTEQVSITPNGQLPDQDLISITIDGPFSKEVNVNLSFTGGLNWRNSNTSSNERIQYYSKINFFTIFIYKNGVLWSSNHPQSNVQGLLYENTFRIPYSIKFENFKFFLNNSLISFLPDVRNNNQTPDVYSIRVSFNFLTTVNNYNVTTDTVSTYTAGFLNFVPCIYSNVSFSYNGSVNSLITTSTATPISIVSYTPGVYAISSYSVNGNVYRIGLDTNTIKEFQCVNSVTHNGNITNATITNGTITNGTITNTSINKISGNTLLEGRIKTRSLLPGYVIDGVNNFFTYPILCSMKGFRPADTDDLYYINPGYKFEIYPNDNYSGTSYSLDNDGNTPVVKQSASVNTLGSIKVFYRNSSSEAYTEITMSFLS